MGTAVPLSLRSVGPHGEALIKYRSTCVAFRFPRILLTLGASWSIYAPMFWCLAAIGWSGLLVSLRWPKSGQHQASQSPAKMTAGALMSEKAAAPPPGKLMDSQHDKTSNKAGDSDNSHKVWHCDTSTQEIPPIYRPKSCTPVKHRKSRHYCSITIRSLRY